MFKKLFYTAVMAVDGLVGMAIGVFALNTAGKWMMEMVDDGMHKTKKFIHEHTSEKTEEANEETED